VPRYARDRSLGSFENGADSPKVASDQPLRQIVSTHPFGAPARLGAGRGVPKDVLMSEKVARRVPLFKNLI